MDYDSNGVFEGAAIWQNYFFMKKTASIALNTRLSFVRTDKKHSRTAGGRVRYLTTYPEEVRFLLKTYVTDEFNARTKSKRTRFAQPSGLSMSQCADELAMKNSAITMCSKSMTAINYSLKNWTSLFVTVCASTAKEKRNQTYKTLRFMSLLYSSCRYVASRSYERTLRSQNVDAT